MIDVVKSIGRTLEINHGMERDAIHVAVIPVTVSQDFDPGDPVSIRDGCAVLSDTPIGVIDPFLSDLVFKGESCWVFLFPGKTTSIRHDWSHPLIPDSKDQVRGKDDNVEASRDWLRSYASRNSPYDGPIEAYERLIDGLLAGEIFYYGSDLHSFSELEEPDELKYHAEKVLGIKIDWSGFTFSCSC